MSGVQSGTRIERLLALRKRVTTELVMLGYREPTMPPRSGGDPHRRGTLPLSTIAAYAAAHRPGAHR